MGETPSHLPAVTVTAPARLHMGFLDLEGGLGRRYGSLGLALEAPVTTLRLQRAARSDATGPESARALRALATFADAWRLAGSWTIRIDEAIPAHAGLGSGTQLALAVGLALAALEGVAHGIRDIGALHARGARSAIGLAAFEHGGFIVDGGKRDAPSPPPLLARLDFPEPWRVLLVLDRHAQGVHGDAEVSAFAALQAMPAATSAHLCRLLLMRILPALVERDLAAFGSGIAEVQAIIGAHFAPAQGGTPWTSPAVGELLSSLADVGAVGIGQSSWGPTGFAFVADAQTAERLAANHAAAAAAHHLEIRIARGRNTPGHVTRHQPILQQN